jgi:hypothetical protein
MRSLDSHFGLGFLLSLGALPIAGCADSDDNDTGASSPTSLATAPTATASDTDDTASDGTAGTNSAGTDPTTDDPTAGTVPTTDDPTATDATDTGVGPTTDPTGVDTGADTGVDLPPACVDIPIPAGCQAFADTLSECYPRYARYYEQYAVYCACNVTYYSMDYGAGCGPAFEDYYACLGAQSCEVLMGDQPYCEAEGMALDTACDFGDTTGGGSGDGGDGG